MLDELHRESYHDAVRVFNPLTYHAAIGSILGGFTRAPIYVDSRDEPRCALTWTKSRIFLSGELGDEDKRRAAETIDEKIKLDNLCRGAKYFVVYIDPDMPQLDFFGLLDDVKVHPNTRNYYELAAITREWGEAPMDGLRLEFIDRRFLGKPYKNLEQVMEEMCSERSSVEEFLEKSVGVCGVIGDEVVSWCMSEYNHGDRYEIGIATVEEHRRRGIATITADTLMRRCLEHGFSRVGWHCWRRNEPSNRTALKLGFRFVESYPVYVLEVES
jgi:RimJ/RimL family protein N-acetyltransferase